VKALKSSKGLWFLCKDSGDHSYAYWQQWHKDDDKHKLLYVKRLISKVASTWFSSNIGFNTTRTVKLSKGLWFLCKDSGNHNYAY
jgi:hypothetical protein